MLEKVKSKVIKDKVQIMKPKLPKLKGENVAFSITTSTVLTFFLYYPLMIKSGAWIIWCLVGLGSNVTLILKNNKLKKNMMEYYNSIGTLK